MRISAALPTGVAALLPAAARARRRLEDRLVAALEGAGFGEVILPILDYLDPYGALVGAADRGRLYRFVDRDGELLVLRGDFTPLLARLLAPRLTVASAAGSMADPDGLALPLRLYYRGDVVRYEPPRAGADRELYQLGAEILGVPGEIGEREALTLFLDLVAAADARGLQLVLGFAGALDALLLAAGGDDPAALAAAVRRRERDTARRASAALLEIVEDGVPRDPAALGPAGERLVALQALRDEVAARVPGVAVRVDLAELATHTAEPRLNGERRGYYDGLVFQLYGRGGEPLGGGGRYDRLFHALGAPVAAVGFSLGLDGLLRAAQAEVAP